MVKRSGPTVLDLFCGAGGMGLGFAQAGFRIIAGADCDVDAAATYEENLGTRVLLANLATLHPADLIRQIGLSAGEPDILIGGPPCQGFSRMRNGAGEKDPRNGLILRYAEFVKVLRPRFAVFENVPGLARSEHGRRFQDALISALEGVGYAAVRWEMDAADYGTPQHRVRVIVVAGRNLVAPPMPWPTHGAPDSQPVKSGFRKRWPTVRDAIGRYPEPGTESAAALHNHWPGELSERVLNFIRAVPHDGGGRKQVPRDLWLPCHLSHSGHSDVYSRLRWDTPSVTITSGCCNPSKGRFVHPDQDRAITPREAAALQGFPDTFRFMAAKVPTQIGNAVPPPLARALAERLAETIAEAPGG